MRQYSYFNSHRADLKKIPKGYRMYADRTRPFSPRETALQKWGGDFLNLDSDHKGRFIEDCGMDRGLLDRTILRFHQPTDGYRCIAHERAQTRPAPGAKPYSGPPRPKLRHEQAAAGG